MKWLLLVALLAFNAYADNPHHEHDGADGIDGVDGEDGAPGTDGADGADGTDGVQGVQGVPGMDGAAGLDGKDWLGTSDWSDDDLNEVFAAATAMAGIDFDSTTSKLQLGIAVGGYGGEEQVAFGIAKVLDNKTVGDVLISFKTAIDNSGPDNDRPWVASAVWKVKLE